MLIIKKINSNRVFVIYLFLLAILSVYTVHLFLPNGLIYFGDDLLFHLQRLKALLKALENGTFPAYIDYDTLETYGYGSKWFYSDLILIPFGMIAYVTNLAFSYKIMIFTLTFGCGLTTYICIKKVLKDEYSAFLGGILYSFCLYRLYDLFLRAALGEVIAFTLLPLIFYGFYEIIIGNYKRWYILSISFSLLLYSHMLSCFLVAGTLIIFCVIGYKSFLLTPKRFYNLILSSIVSLFLTSYFLLPFFEQLSSNIFYFNKYRVFYLANYTIPLDVFFKSLKNGITFSSDITYPSIGFVLILPQFFRFFIKYKSTPFLKYADTALVLGILYTITCFDIFPWHLFPLNRMNLIQFPYRFFLISSFFLTFSGSYYISLIIKNKIYRFFTLIIVLIFVIIFNIYYEFSIIKNREPFIFAHQDVGTGEYYPLKFSPDFLITKKNKIDCKKQSTKINSFNKNIGITSFDVIVEEQDTLEIPLLYYKGYNATLNNQQIEVRQSNYGFIDLSIKESGAVKVYFGGTFIQKYSLYITIFAFIILILYILVYIKKDN